jgi:VCBS repeat-containing protein
LTSRLSFNDPVVTTTQNQAISGLVGINDAVVTDKLTYTLLADTASGHVTFDQLGNFTFDPGHSLDSLAAAETRVLGFDFVATNQFGVTSGQRHGTVTVQGANDAPTVANETVAVVAGATATKAFAGTDVDHNDALNYHLVTGPTLGTVVVNTDGTFTFDAGHAFDTLPSGQTQVVSFTYQASDSAGAASNVATVAVTVSGTQATFGVAAHNVSAATSQNQSVSSPFAATDNNPKSTSIG